MDDEKEVLNYAAGDHVGIFPGNSQELVMGILKHLPSDPLTNQSVRLEYVPEASSGKKKKKKENSNKLARNNIDYQMICNRTHQLKE